MLCLICGENKERDQFKHVMYFSQYKKKRVAWCQDCQKMYIAYKKEKEAENKFKTVDVNFKVSF